MSTSAPAKLVEPSLLNGLRYSQEKGIDHLFEKRLVVTKPSQTLQSSRRTIPISSPQLIFDSSFFNTTNIAPSSPSSIIITKNKSGYSSVFIHQKLDESNTTYCWSVKINTVNSWLSIGVATPLVVDGRQFTLTPFDEHGQVMLSANGYIWDRRMSGENKNLLLQESSFGVGDVISVELDSQVGQLTFLKNNVVITTRNVKLPVYPSFMMHGTESVEFMGITESENHCEEGDSTLEFVYPKHHIQCVNGRRGFIRKLTSGSYVSVFLKKVLGDAMNYGLYRWKIKILTLDSWIGVGAVAKDIAQECFHDISPFSNFGGYMYTMNGYVWSHFYNGEEKRANIGQTSTTGDVICLELNCSTRELVISKDDNVIVTFKDIYLPVLPFIMAHGEDVVEVMDFQQVATFPSPIIPKIENLSVLNYNQALIERNGPLVWKPVNSGGYSNVWVDYVCKPEDIVKRWRIRVDHLDRYNAVGVIMENEAKNINYSTSPYNQEGAYLLDHEGTCWDRFSEPKQKLDNTAKYKKGDVIIVEMNCITKEVSFYKNNIGNRIAKINHVKLPVYPFLMIYGNESLEILNYTDNILDISKGTSLLGRVPSFKCDTSSVAINGRRITKISISSYTSIFIDTLLGTMNHDKSVFQWRVKIVKFTWIGVGVIRRDMGDLSNFSASPFDETGGYFLTGNGYVWDRHLNNVNEFKEGSEFGVDDVLICTLDCGAQTLQIHRNDKEIMLFTNVRLPVYPLIMFHNLDSIDFEWL